MIKLKKLLEDKIVFSKGEMSKLHNDGQIEKDGHVIVYDESVNEARGDHNDIQANYMELMKDFERGYSALTLKVDKLRGDKVDGNILRKEYSKQVGKLQSMWRSWYRNMERRPK